ncbi:hypothetical protein AB0K16_42555 [Nonomuraea jabiensis]|uniref:hypothetical protein n=1 Tax=Nonomuraea jabiensis TaxID=882448 RepID=UPI003436083F
MEVAGYAARAADMLALRLDDDLGKRGHAFSKSTKRQRLYDPQDRGRLYRFITHRVVLGLRL